MSERIISSLAPSLARRVIAAGSPGGLGIVVLWLALLHPAPTAAQMTGLVALGAASLAFAVIVWRATRHGLVLTDLELRDTSGRQLFQLDEVDLVEKGALSWKPAGGFAVVLTERRPRIWVPGLWWRVGRRVMVGGATNGGEAKAMADLLRMELARRSS